MGLNPDRRKDAKEKRRALKIEKNSRIVLSALEQGAETRKKIVEVTNLTKFEVNDVFIENKELYSQFKAMRATLVNTAADNVTEIINNPDHPKNYDASMKVLSLYKSDLDESLISKEAEELRIDLDNDGNSPVVINFRKPE